MAWFDARCQDRAVDISRAGEGRVIILEEDAVARECRERGAVPIGYEIGAHAVPDDDNDALRFADILVGQSCRDEGEESGGKKESARHEREICTAAA